MNQINQKTEGKPAKISLKKYLRELRHLHGELVALQRWVQHEGLKVCIIFEGRHNQGDYRARQPARLPHRRPAHAHRARKKPDLPATLHPAPAGRRRSRHLRPQLVQQGRRGARDGLLHRRRLLQIPDHHAVF